MATKVLALVTSYDETTANQEAMAGAAQQFDDLLQAGSFTLSVISCGFPVNRHVTLSQNGCSRIQMTSCRRACPQPQPCVTAFPCTRMQC